MSNRSTRRAWLAGLTLVAALAWLVTTRWPTEPVPNGATAGAGPQQTAPAQAVQAATDPRTTGVPAEAPPPKLMVDIARLVPRRASEAERADYRRRLDSDSDLAELAKALDAHAQTGDADAAATLAELLRACTDVLSYVPRPARPDRSGAQPMPMPTNPQAQRCAGFGPPGELTGFNLRSGAQAWTATAARLGHPASVLADRRRRSPSWGTPVDAAELRERAAAEELLRARGFAVLTGHAFVLGELSHHRMHAAWQTTLCEMAAPCDWRKRTCDSACDQRRLQMDMLRMPPRQRRELAGQQLQILQAMQTGRFDELWRRSPGAGGRP